jgi:photosystem II stability/assembly factor-like uncharacterized protein
LVSKRKRQVKKKVKVKKTAKRTSVEKHVDDPYLRHQETAMDLAAEGKPISKLRLAALKQARQMHVSDDGTPGPQTAEHIFSQPTISEKSNWVQMGPTAIPDGQTIATYYGKPNIPAAMVTGRITAIVIDPVNPNIIYLGTAQGGIWKTIDSGRNWAAKSDYAPSLSIGALVMDPMNPSILYAGTGEGNIAIEILGGHHPESYYGCGILKTTDGGEKWTLLGGEDNEFIGASFFRLAINPLNSSTIFAASSGGLYRSTDNGEHWSQLSINLSEDIESIIPATDIVINPLDPDVVYAGFRSKGIYKTTNANADNPAWTKLEGEEDKKLPINGFNRIALGISKSSPQTIYALMARDRPKDRNDDENGSEVFRNSDGRLWQSDVIDSFYRSTDGGTTWTRIDLPGKGTLSDPWCKGSIGTLGFYNLNVAVDPTTPDIVYLGGVSLWKAIHNMTDERWDIRDIGEYIHPDNHAFAFNPSNPFVIYAGNDGGIYKSVDGGETWIDVINEGLCITQFEFMDQHPNSDAVLFGGTQDNGTLQFRNNPAFYYSDYGDGGFVSIDPQHPNNIIHQYTGTTLYHSIRAGRRDADGKIWWKSIEKGIKGKPSLFYAPFTLDQQNSKNIAFGSDRIFLDRNQGLMGWKTPAGKKNFIKLPFLKKDQDGNSVELVSAINFVDSSLIYAGTTNGKVIRAIKTSDGWEANQINDGSLPELYIWDVAPIPGIDNEVIVVMAGYGSQEKPPSHIWHATISDDKRTAVWDDISGKDKGRLPDTPINSIVIDPKPPHTIYIGTDIGVFRTSSNNDKTWIRFSHGLPNCAVYDMRLHTSIARRLLRIVTHGRGVWERDLDSESMPDVNLFVRDHLMDTGRFTPSSDSIKAAFDEDLPQNEDQNNRITLGTTLKWHMCADIKVDSPDSPTGKPPSYQMDIEAVDYVKFEYQLFHRNLVPGRVNRVYVQVRNRGIKAAEKQVNIKLLYANAIGNNPIKYPELPQDFWTAFPNDPKDTSNWKPIGEYKVLPDLPKTLTHTEPTIVSWQWNVPPIEDGQLGILVIIDSQEDHIPESNKVFDIETLVKNEKHVGLRTVDVVKSR